MKIRDIKEYFNKLRHGFSKSKIIEIRRNLYDVKNLKSLSKSKIKEIEENFLELEKSFFRLEKYYDCYDTEYKGTRDIKNSFDLSTDEDYHKPVKTKSAFKNN